MDSIMTTVQDVETVAQDVGKIYETAKKELQEHETIPQIMKTNAPEVKNTLIDIGKMFADVESLREMLKNPEDIATIINSWNNGALKAVIDFTPIIAHKDIKCQDIFCKEIVHKKGEPAMSIQGSIVNSLCEKCFMELAK